MRILTMKGVPDQVLIEVIKNSFKVYFNQCINTTGDLLRCCPENQLKISRIEIDNDGIPQDIAKNSTKSNSQKLLSFFLMTMINQKVTSNVRSACLYVLIVFLCLRFYKMLQNYIYKNQSFQNNAALIFEGESLELSDFKKYMFSGMFR